MKTLLKAIIAIVVVVGFSTDGYSQRRTLTKTTKRSNVVYRTSKKRVTTVRTLPRNTRIIKHNGINVYYSNNRYYKLNAGRYIPIAPSIGLRVVRLPVGYKTVRYNNRRYYTHNGIFYIQINNTYEVVNPEVGTVVYELPSEAEKVTINGERFYEYNNVLYEKIQVNGTRAYEVVGMIEMN